MKLKNRSMSLETSRNLLMNLTGLLKTQELFQIQRTKDNADHVYPLLYQAKSNLIMQSKRINAYPSLSNKLLTALILMKTVMAKVVMGLMILSSMTLSLTIKD